MNCETDFVAKTPDSSVGQDIAMHIAASSPLYVSKEDVPAEVRTRRRRSTGPGRGPGKPAAVLDRSAEGKLKDYYATYCLLEQPFVRDGKLTVGQLVQEKVALIKENIVVRRFARFRVGEESQPGAAGQTNTVAVG